ncbi:MULTISPECIES: ABC transporter substrate-binding protein [unclassified Aureimonas]|uniref:ABC transporter substrate-binding protein n=1 Tax=unclassified Aureimonas TaxID=2615206 RepID=UPI0006FED9C4|nr:MULTISPECIES: ABC transporter substrate-binding protein [unclassified Aureimonas]KQT63985.1 ABC transporter substrate-binding protein [Aureimonas sp. Leaf427]KQT81178.1 ABC transporter substrate-binding protein [Aureimonas sp. Leaf460]
MTTDSPAGTRGLSRRSLIKSAAGVGLVAGGTAIAGSLGMRRAIAGNPSKIRLAWTEVAACHAPLGFGVAKGFYEKHDLDVELFYQGASGQTLIQALATGKADVGAGLIGDWLKPLEQGFDVKLFVGSHGGCQRLLASKASGVTDLAGVKGKTIATYGIGAPPQVAFQVTLAKAGIDPEADVTWKVVPFELVGEAVNRGDADIAAHLDPWAYSIEKQFDFIKLADTQTGVYQDHTCCVLGANGPYLDENRDAVRRLAEANIEIHDYVTGHVEEVAAWYLEALKPAGLSLPDLTAVIGGLVTHNHPIGRPLIDQIQRSAEDLKLVKVLEETTDPKEFAERVTVDILS